MTAFCKTIVIAWVILILLAVAALGLRLRCPLRKFRLSYGGAANWNIVSNRCANTTYSEEVAAMTLARPPFDGVDLILISHGHSDHLATDCGELPTERPPSRARLNGVGDRPLSILPSARQAY